MPDRHQEPNPFPDWLGIRIEEWREDFIRMSLQTGENHLNRSGRLHGGVTSALLEYGAGMCGLHCTVPGNRRYGVTLSLTCNYVGAARGRTLSVTGRRSGGGRKVYFAQTEVRDDEGTLVASATSVHRYQSGSEDPAGVPDDR